MIAIRHVTGFLVGGGSKHWLLAMVGGRDETLELNGTIWFAGFGEFWLGLVGILFLIGFLGIFEVGCLKWGGLIQEFFELMIFYANWGRDLSF